MLVTFGPTLPYKKLACELRAHPPTKKRKKKNTEPLSWLGVGG